MGLHVLNAFALLILATTAAAFNEIPQRVEVSDDMNPWLSDVEDTNEAESYWRRNLLLYRLLKLLQGESDRYNEEDDLNQNKAEYPDIKEANEKKWVAALSTNLGKGTKTPKPRAQRKWKSKKGKGIPMLCYFKLCSFRSPV